MMRVLTGAVVVVLLLGACSSGDAEAEALRFCELIEQYNKGTGFEAPPEDTPQAEQPEALTKALRAYLELPEIQAILDELGEVAPAEVADAVGVMRDVAAHLVETGESNFESEEAAAANETIMGYTEVQCAPKDQPSDGAEDGAGEAGADEGADDTAAEGESEQ